VGFRSPCKVTSTQTSNGNFEICCLPRSIKILQENVRLKIYAYCRLSFLYFHEDYGINGSIVSGFTSRETGVHAWTEHRLLNFERISIIIIHLLTLIIDENSSSYNDIEKKIWRSKAQP